MFVRPTRGADPAMRELRYTMGRERRDMAQIATEFLNQIQNPVVYALPVFVASMAIEAAALRNDARPTAGYVRDEARSSIIMGLGSLAFMFVFKLATLVAFSVIYLELAPWQLPTTSWWVWFVLLIAVDLTWYCNHRFSHRVRIGWAGHRAHHSSETSTSAAPYDSNGIRGRRRFSGCHCRCWDLHPGRSTSRTAST